MADSKFSEDNKLYVGSRKVAGNWRHNSIFVTDQNELPLYEIHGLPAANSGKAGLTTSDALGQPRLAVVSHPRNADTAGRPLETGIRPGEDDRRTWREIKPEGGKSLEKMWSDMIVAASRLNNQQHKYFPFPNGERSAHQKRVLNNMPYQKDTDPADMERVGGWDNTWNSNSAFSAVLKSAGLDPDKFQPRSLPGQSTPGADLDIPDNKSKPPRRRSMEELSKIMYPGGEWNKTGDR